MELCIWLDDYVANEETTRLIEGNIMPAMMPKINNNGVKLRLCLEIRQSEGRAFCVFAINPSR
eukprot:m.66370 g.66370  ORF g.66370 m.66370 type:complete len:63 (-) comp23679_c0_seq1:1596-1784(-)